VNTSRLRTLAAFLRTLPPERFNYAHWVGDDWQGAPDLSCGTTACALGWATTIPEFRAAGLRLVRTVIGLEVLFEDEDGFVTDDSTTSAEAFFDISRSDARWLFVPWTWTVGPDGASGPNEDASALEVADHIDRFVDAYEAQHGSAEGRGT
jgi:hypothetical protein